MSAAGDTSSDDEKVYDSDGETTPRESTSAGPHHNRGQGPLTHNSNTKFEDTKEDDDDKTYDFLESDHPHHRIDRPDKSPPRTGPDFVALSELSLEDTEKNKEDPVLYCNTEPIAGKGSYN